MSFSINQIAVVKRTKGPFLPGAFKDSHICLVIDGEKYLLTILTRMADRYIFVARGGKAFFLSARFFFCN